MDIDPLSAAFLAFLCLGLLWITWRIGRYIRFHRERDYAWSQFGSEEEFRKLIEDLRKPKGNEDAGTANEARPSSPPSQEGDNSPRLDQPPGDAGLAEKALDRK
jgi:hypothetical protein